MHIEHIRNIPGPNVYSHSPVLVMTLDLEDLYKKESHEVPGFIDRLCQLLPGVHEHFCSLGYAGGFVERLHEGTWFGHIVEHVALELSEAAGIPVNRGKTVSDNQPGKFLVAVTHKSEAGMRMLLRTAVELVEALIEDRPYPLSEKIAEAKRIVSDSCIGPSTQAILDAAFERNIPYTILQDGCSFVRFGYGKQSRLMEATISGKTSAVAVSIASDKHLTKTLLCDAGIPCPREFVVRSREEAIETWKQFESAVVVKPLDGNQGRGVSLNLTTAEQVSEAFDVAAEHSQNVIIEELFTGRDYRALVIDGRLVAASEKTPARVTGDGKHSISELIEITNQDPRRGTNHSKSLSCIEVDAVMTAYLRRNHLNLESVPNAGEIVLLRESANLSTGGEATDVTDIVHPQTARMLERAARIIGLDICGIDVVVPDISEPLDGKGGIIEVNAAPGIRMHCHPSSGTPRKVGHAIVDLLYPNESTGRIPIISITGTNGKTTVARMIAHAVGSSGKLVGLTGTDGITIGGNVIAEGDMSGPASARLVLGDPSVEVAVLETARGGIVRSGLGYDWSDIGILTNIQSDHIGQDGITCAEDIFKIKSLVAQRVREGGTLILNADDEYLISLPRHPRIADRPRNIVFFSLDPENEVVQRHIAKGGVAYVRNNRRIEQWRSREKRVLTDVAGIPSTFGGLAEFQVANVLAALAACIAYGMPPNAAIHALAGFDSASQNGGRLSLYECSGRIVMIDYGHNTGAIRSVAQMIKRLEPLRTTAILGLPGDRRDDLIIEAAAEAASGFDRIILREDRDLRGRQAGEIPTLMESAIRHMVPKVEVQIIRDEIEALSFALNQSQPGDLIAVFYEQKKPLLSFLNGEGAVHMKDLAAAKDVLQREWSVSA